MWMTSEATDDDDGTTFHCGRDENHRRLAFSYTYLYYFVDTLYIMFGTTTTIARVSRLGAGTPRHGRTFSSLWSSSLCCPDDDVGDLSRRRHGMVSRRGRHGHAHRSLYDDRSVMFRRRYASDLAGSVSIQDPTSFYTDEQRQIMQKTKELHQSIMPLNEKVSRRSSNSRELACRIPLIRRISFFHFFLHSSADRCRRRRRRIRGRPSYRRSSSWAIIPVANRRSSITC